uniref:Uncharacterized protein n=2 Tax=Schistocephalus solidus TaxID=70667 RepID=A0A0X3P4C2_SCHSO
MHWFWEASKENIFCMQLRQHRQIQKRKNRPKGVELQQAFFIIERESEMFHFESITSKFSEKGPSCTGDNDWYVKVTRPEDQKRSTVTERCNSRHHERSAVNESQNLFQIVFFQNGLGFIYNRPHYCS